MYDCRMSETLAIRPLAPDCAVAEINHTNDAVPARVGMGRMGY